MCFWSMLWVVFESWVLVICNRRLICTSNLNVGEGDLGYIFEKFEIAQVAQGQFQNFQKSQAQFFLKIARTKYVITS